MQKRLYRLNEKQEALIGDKIEVIFINPTDALLLLMTLITIGLLVITGPTLIDKAKKK